VLALAEANLSQIEYSNTSSSIMLAVTP